MYARAGKTIISRKGFIYRRVECGVSVYFSMRSPAHQVHYATIPLPCFVFNKKIFIINQPPFCIEYLTLP